MSDPTGKGKVTSAQVMAGREVREDLTWPGKPGITVSLLLLTCDEMQRGHFAARQHFSRRGHPTVDPITAEEFAHEEDAQMCYRAILQPGSRDPKDRVFASAEQARKGLGPHERAYFVTHAVALQDELIASWERPIGNEHLLQIALALGLPDEAGPDEVVAAVRDLLDSGAGAAE